MINLTKNQKILAFICIVIILLVIIYYFYQNFQNTGYEKLEEGSFESKETVEKSEGEILIHITGSVKEEGVVRLKEGARVIDAIEESGGLLEDANLNKVNLAYPLSDGQKVYIPSDSDDETEEIIIDDVGEKIISEGDKNTEKLNGKKVNINTAMQIELEELPGIGTSTAYNIVEYRKENGLFSQIEDIKNVSGIGDAKFNQIKDFISVK